MALSSMPLVVLSVSTRLRCLVTMGLTTMVTAAQIVWIPIVRMIQHALRAARELFDTW